MDLLTQNYPIDLIQQGISGIVLLYIFIDVEGKPTTVHMCNSSGVPELDKIAVDVMTASYYLPARIDGVPVPAWVSIPITFRIGAPSGLGVVDVTPFAVPAPGEDGGNTP